jgi:two-component system, OmpR family, response regulator MprA
MLILLVEDEAPLARLIERVLREEGYQSHVESRAETALKAATSEPPELVILDLGLPDMDGLALCRRLRDRDLRMPVLMLTARDAVPDRVRGLDAGADDYLVKPFAFEELLARIRALLRRGTQDETIEFADLVIVPSKRTVRRAGRAIELTDQEFRLLELLARHPERVLTRERIIDHVWGYRSSPTSNVVDLYIHYLRQKVDREHDRKLIRTVRAVGYTLRA